VRPKRGLKGTGTHQQARRGMGHLKNLGKSPSNKLHRRKEGKEGVRFRKIYWDLGTGVKDGQKRAVGKDCYHWRHGKSSGKKTHEKKEYD